MHDAAWKLDAHQARLDMGGLAGSVHLLRPADGLGELRRDKGPPLRTRLLSIAVPGFMAGDAGELIECHARGGDLAAAYRESPTWPVRLDTLWRAMPLAGALGTIQLVLSVRTYMLDCRPQLTVSSSIRADEVLAVDPSSAAWPLPRATEGWTAVEHPKACCVLFRLTGAPWSYAEMVHPADFQRDELLREADPIVPVQLRHWLFPGALEKGVILRARVVGFFLPRADDLALAAAAARAFTASEPPLD